MLRSIGWVGNFSRGCWGLVGTRSGFRELRITKFCSRRPSVALGPCRWHVAVGLSDFDMIRGRVNRRPGIDRASRAERFPTFAASLRQRKSRQPMRTTHTASLPSGICEKPSMNLKFLTPDRAEWDQFLDGVRHDFYHRAAYARLMAPYDGGQPEAVLVSSGDSYFFFALHIVPAVLHSLAGDRGQHALRHCVPLRLPGTAFQWRRCFPPSGHRRVAPAHRGSAAV